MKTIRELEGELLIDHRNSPGVPAELLHAAGLPTEAGRGVYEAPIYTCGHCQAGVFVVVTAFGGREKRYVCGGCKHVLCDACAKQKSLTGICTPFEAKIDAYLESVEKHTPLILLE